jgi:hypothetical protein
MPHSIVNNKTGREIICEQWLSNLCPKSDIRLMAEHGTPQKAIYWSFGCRTCKHITLDWNPAYVEAAKRQELDREIGRLINPRFKGID